MAPLRPFIASRQLTYKNQFFWMKLQEAMKWPVRILTCVYTREFGYYILTSSEEESLSFNRILRKIHFSALNIFTQAALFGDFSVHFNTFHRSGGSQFEIPTVIYALCVGTRWLVYCQVRITDCLPSPIIFFSHDGQLHSVHFPTSQWKRQLTKEHASADGSVSVCMVHNIH